MKTFLFTLIAGLTFILKVPAQNPEWLVYDKTNSGLRDNDIRSLDIDNNGIIWIGSINKSVFTFDRNSWNRYSSSNSYIYDSYILCISTDSQNNKWIGTRSGGMAMFNGTNWHLYDSDHSGIPTGKVSDIQFEGSLVWVATQHGLAKFDRTNWTVYNTSNSGIPGDEIRGVAIDNQGNKWVASWSGGLGKFDGTNWTTFNKSNSVMPTDMCVSIFFDGTFIWIGTSLGGHVKFDGSTMEVLTPENSGILHKTVLIPKKKERNCGLQLQVGWLRLKELHGKRIRLKTQDYLRFMPGILRLINLVINGLRPIKEWQFFVKVVWLALKEYQKQQPIFFFTLPIPIRLKSLRF